LTPSGAHVSFTPGRRTVVTPSPTNPNRVYFDFDPASPGGRGGASVLLDPTQGLASVDGVHKNGHLRRATGALLADGLQQTSVPQPSILEGYNVEKTTAVALAAGGSGQGTWIGKLLADAATALGGRVTTWEPVRDGTIWHLRIHIEYP
jgi:hypothetical protein